MNNVYTVQESAEMIAVRWLKAAERILSEGQKPLPLSVYTRQQLAELAPLNRRSYTWRTWSRVHRLAIEYGRRALVTDPTKWPLTLAWATGKKPEACSHVWERLPDGAEACFECDAKR